MCAECLADGQLPTCDPASEVGSDRSVRRALLPGLLLDALQFALIRSCVTLYQRETTSPRQSGLARRRYGVTRCAFQPAKPPILSTSSTGTSPRSWMIFAPMSRAPSPRRDRPRSRLSQRQSHPPFVSPILILTEEIPDGCCRQYRYSCQSCPYHRLLELEVLAGQHPDRRRLFDELPGIRTDDLPDAALCRNVEYPLGHCAVENDRVGRLVCVR